MIWERNYLSSIICLELADFQQGNEHFFGRKKSYFIPILEKKIILLRT